MQRGHINLVLKYNVKSQSREKIGGIIDKKKEKITKKRYTDYACKLKREKKKNTYAYEKDFYTEEKTMLQKHQALYWINDNPLG